MTRVEELRRRGQAMTRHAPSHELALAGSGAIAFERAKRWLAAATLHPVTDFRLEGAVSDSGLGYLTDEVPFGGSVIEGYHLAFTVVLEDAVLTFEENGETPGAPTTVRLWGSAARVAEFVAALTAQG